MTEPQTHVRTYPFSLAVLVRSMWGHFLVAAILAAIGCGSFALADRANAPANGPEIMLGVFLALAAIPFGLLAYRYARRTRWVRLSDQGLGWAGPGGERFRPWEEVAGVIRSEILEEGVRRISEVRVKFTDDTAVSFTQMLAKYDTFLKDLQGAVAEMALLRAREQLDAGRPARFGPVSVEPTGLRIANTLVPWPEVRQWTVHNGILFVFGPAGERSELLLNIPDYPALLVLVAESAGPMTPPHESELFVGRSAQS